MVNGADPNSYNVHADPWFFRGIPCWGHIGGKNLFFFRSFVFPLIFNHLSGDACLIGKKNQWSPYQLKQCGPRRKRNLSGGVVMLVLNH